MTLPTVEDFTVTEQPEEDLDGFAAWKSFGGLSVDDAYRKFCDCPAGRQEDFMWMGNRAFAFYFPVLERYLREQEPRLDFDGEACVLAQCIAMHLPGDEPCIRAQHDRYRGLCTFVLDSLRALQDRADRARPVHEVRSAWSALQAKLA